ncbi:hypothetical protein HYH03_018751 [Edaphochlamys debaryana]|uniref:BTB domain-containing protein n=1 Tax=Edaphochlamys debaryana TaxID=47281 RepID=A0A835XFA3_9CHLO|nr:hypothetical protein HYH03_018751 [Edaphochlamys debaryana]|eukprot:KAG2482309.1 hypothetical protein HYH03_018751 [Edaphochlamys debaryana]
MQCVLKGTLPLPGRLGGVIARPLPEGTDPQVLVLTTDGAFFPLLGACGHSGLRLGPALSLFEAADEAPGQPLRPYRPLELADSPPYSCPTWDPWSRSAFFIAGHAVYRLTSENLVELVAGDPEEEGDPENEDEEEAAAAAGAGPANDDVLLSYPSDLVSDGKGSIYCTTSDGSLITGIVGALYRLPLGPGGGPGPAVVDPVLLAGRRGQEGERDGRGDRARFTEIAGMASIGDGGGLVVLQSRPGNGLRLTGAVRRVTPDGTVTTLASGLTGCFFGQPFILPNGYLAVCDGETFLLLDLGLKPLPLLPAPAATPADPPRRTLPADMGALLDAQPDGTADLTLVVAGRRFPAHRAILIARCDYFRQRLEGGFADGTAAELSLPDADPAAFELLLRWVYTGAVDIPPAVAELADRLLLPELCADAQAVVLSGVSAAGVVGSLLWAERLGPSFSGLQSSLKAWAVEHYEEVRGGGSLRRLMAEGPGLMEGLADALAKRRRSQ